MLDIKELKLEFFPFNESLNLRDGIESLNLRDGIEFEKKIERDKYDNPIFIIRSDIECIIQKNRNKTLYIAFIKVRSENGARTYFKAFAPDDKNDIVLFSNFKEVIKEEESGR